MPATLDGWLALLEARTGQTIQLGLERVARVRDRLGLTSNALVITVGGTNGKGSTCAMLEAIAVAAGYRVGVYTSPHLLRYTERVRLAGQEVAPESLTAAFGEVEAAREGLPLTYFEHGTLAAWCIFARAELDLIILEVGLGGRLDAVNAFEPDCTVVTSVALDHQDFLGETREEIGFEKAGIFRPGKPAVCGDPHPPRSLLDHADAIGADLWVSGRDFGFGGDRQQWGYWRYEAAPAHGRLLRRGGLAYPSLRGANQLLNASATLTALELLRDRLPVPMQAVRQGLMLVDLPGRFQVLPGRPAVVLDVAHNAQAVGVLAENLGSMGYFPETWAVVGMLRDKDVQGTVSLLADRVDHWAFAGLPGPRGLSADDLATEARAAGLAGDGREFPTPADAYRAVRKEAAPDDRIVVFGSFLTVASVLEVVQGERH
ncbi:MAG: bifunctional tetrahydrofolate synthase/dihydrofolate synthase [Zoogloeaceae bacterium]|nr:bifunctional tetrahydrofolate synthase/dihydrofolate synthase [Zoogloeaceae bacterium]